MLVIAVGLLVAGSVIVVLGTRATGQTTATLGPARVRPGESIQFTDGLVPAVHAAKAAAGPHWTGWLLSEMRQVSGGVADQPPNFCCTGGGRWGIIDGLPPELAAEVSIKNGWTPIWADGLWHVNCLAIHPDWVLCVQARYPYPLGLQYGADACRSVTEQLLTKHH